MIVTGLLLNRPQIEENSFSSSALSGRRSSFPTSLLELAPLSISITCCFCKIISGRSVSMKWIFSVRHKLSPLPENPEESSRIFSDAIFFNSLSMERYLFSKWISARRSAALSFIVSSNSCVYAGRSKTAAISLAKGILVCAFNCTRNLAVGLMLVKFRSMEARVESQK